MHARLIKVIPCQWPAISFLLARSAGNVEGRSSSQNSQKEKTFSIKKAYVTVFP